MLNILLINPPMFHRKGNIWKGVGSCMPPLGLAYIASYLEKHGFGVSILDAHAERISVDEVAAHIDFEYFDMVGVTATTNLIANALLILKNIKERDPEMVTILGGVHPTVAPEEVLANPCVDIVVRGEGEQTLLEIMKGKPLSDIPGVSYRENGSFRHNADRELLGDLDSLPLPAYHLLPMSKYYPALGAYKRLPATSIVSTRGCPGRCTFCYRIFGSSFRVRSGRNVADEVCLLVRKWGYKEISFYDDTFTSSKDNVLEFCQAIKDERLNITWSCFSRADKVDEEMLRAMKSVGCHQISYGVESVSPRVLKKINKKMDVKTSEKAIRLASNIGIDTRVALMLGNPGDSIETMQESLDWAIKINPDILMFNIATPYPGTAMYRWAKKKGYLITEDWNDYDLSKVVMRLPTVSPEEVSAFYRYAFRKFYLRPGYLLKRIKRLRSPEELLSYARALISVVDVF